MHEWEKEETTARRTAACDHKSRVSGRSVRSNCGEPEPTNKLQSVTKKTFLPHTYHGQRIVEVLANFIAACHELNHGTRGESSCVSSCSLGVVSES